MSLKTLLPNKDYILHEGEIYFISIEDTFPHTGIYIEGKGYKAILSSTASMQGVKQLDRSLFVKGVDVEELAAIRFPMSDNSNFDHLHHLRVGFIAGYNANKNEFTRDEVITLMMKAVFKVGTGEFVDIEEIINNLRPLSLPSSIIIEGEEITKINW